MRTTLRAPALCCSKRTPPDCSYRSIVGSGRDLSSRELAELLRAVVGYRGVLSGTYIGRTARHGSFWIADAFMQRAGARGIGLQDGVIDTYAGTRKRQNSGGGILISNNVNLQEKAHWVWR